MSEVKLVNKFLENYGQIIIVIFAGVIVSLSLFFISGNFTNIKLAEGQNERLSGAKKEIEQEFISLQNSYYEALELAKLLTSDSIKSINSYEMHDERISSLFWISAKNLSLSASPEVIPFVGYYTNADANWYVNRESIAKIKNIYKVFSRKDIGVVKSFSVVADRAGNIHDKSAVNNYEAMLLTSLVRSKDKELGVLIGVADVKSIFQRPYLYETLGIARISISLDNISHVFDMPDRNNKADLFGGGYEGSFAYSKFQKIYNINIKFKGSLFEILLGLTPMILSTILLCFTFLYAFVKYTNIIRTNEMRDLNEGLAHKNMALKAEVKKREAMNFIVRQSEQQNKAIINSVNDVIFELNSDGKIMFINDTWYRITGHSIANTVNKTLFSYLSEDEEMVETKKIQELLNGKRSAYVSLYKLRSSDGQFKPVEMTISMLRQDNDNNLRIVGTIANLEDKEKAERAVVEAEENYKRIWKNAANGIYEVAMDGSLMSANPAMARILGYDDTEQLIRSMTNMNDMIYVNSTEKAAQINVAIREKKTKKFEIKAYRKDGEEIWLEEFMQTVTDDDGNIIHLEGIIDDITKRKMAGEELLRAKAESDMANRAKSDFLANMSHELRTPLNSIIGFAEIIRDEVMGKIKEPVYTEYAGEIHKSGNGLLSIINQILDVSKIESGDRELNESLVNLNKVADDTLNLFSAKIKEKQLSVTNKVGDDVSNLIAEDRSVRQMLYNIISNAVKFTPSEGKISINAKIDDESNMRLLISDTGEGMSKSQLDRALKPFDLLDGEHSREKYGAGLGLTLVKLLMDMHGGCIDMQSKEGVGTTVSLVFPNTRIRNTVSDIDKPVIDKPVIDVNGFDGADVFSDSGSDSVH